MELREIRKWLADHDEDIFAVSDLEPDDETLHYDTYFRYWFGPGDFNPAGYTFESICQDGTGGKFAVWSGSDAAERPLVFFGSEGGHGVITRDFTLWPLMIAHGIYVAEYGPDLGASQVVSGLAPGPEPEGDEDMERRAALERYRQATISRFGQLPEFDGMSAGCDELNREFRAWVEQNIN